MLFDPFRTHQASPEFFPARFFHTNQGIALQADFDAEITSNPSRLSSVRLTRLTCLRIVQASAARAAAGHRPTEDPLMSEGVSLPAFRSSRPAPAILIRSQRHGANEDPDRCRPVIWMAGSTRTAKFLALQSHPQAALNRVRVARAVTVSPGELGEVSEGREADLLLGLSDLSAATGQSQGWGGIKIWK